MASTGYTEIVDRGFTFRTEILRHEKLPNFGRSAVHEMLLLWQL